MTAAYDTAKRVLDHAAAVLLAAGRPVPDRVCVTPGALSAWDCEQLTVAVPRPSVAGGVALENNARPRPIPGPRFAEVRIELIRCITCNSQDVIPSPQELDASASSLLDDARALETGLVPAAMTGGEGRSVQIGPVTLAGPDGGYASVYCSILLPL